MDFIVVLIFFLAGLNLGLDLCVKFKDATEKRVEALFNKYEKKESEDK